MHTSKRKRHNRHTIRLKDFDYRQVGAYFVTIVAFKRRCLFGKIVNDEMRRSVFGQIAQVEWFKTAKLRNNVNLREDEFVVMPSHIHGIIWISDNDSVAVGAERRSAPTAIQRPHVPAGSLGAIVRAYKSAVTYQINRMRKMPGSSVWQRNYYEHIIRNQIELERIHKYIQINPFRWSEDEENPAWQIHH